MPALCPPSEVLIPQMRAELGPRVMLAFSRGKDAISAYLALRPHFDDIIPFHLSLVPGLEFVEESLQHYEQLMGTHIYRLPSPSCYRLLNHFTFQPPAHAAVIAAAKLPEFSYQDVYAMVGEAAGLAPEVQLTANGVRSADSPLRMISIRQHGPVTRSRGHWMPVWDWRKDRVIETIAASEFRLPIDYKLWGRTFDGLDLRFMAPMKKHLPRDYARVCELFPLVEAELFRFERFGHAAAA